MVTWGEFAAAAPDIAAKGKALPYRTGHGEALLVTVQGDDPPQDHPISVSLVSDGLYAFILHLRSSEISRRMAAMPSTPTSTRACPTSSCCAAGCGPSMR